MQADTSTKLTQLRHWMSSHDLDCYIVPRSDEYLNEYVPAHNERLLWLTGFSGSAGTAVITKDNAFLFTDGRYTLQAEKECGALYTIKNSVDEKLSLFLKTLALTRTGYDPRLFSIKMIEELEKELQGAALNLITLAENPVDLFWHNRPAPLHKEGFVHDVAFAGQMHDDKIARIADAVAAQSCHALLVTDPTAIAWLLNVRGFDIPHMPVILSTLVLHTDRRVQWFVEQDKLSPEIRAHLQNIEICKPHFDAGHFTGKTILLDPGITPMCYAQDLKQAGAIVRYGTDPIQKEKACKNAIEIENMRASHRRDGAVIKEFLNYIKTHPHLDELEIALKLRETRSQQNHFIDESFSTIAGVGANGAIVHYHPHADTNKKLEQGNLLLLDSGAHYLDGTTDITRTIAIGTPTAEHKYHYTLVLKGHIALITAIFPHGTNGAQLDGLARQYLWHAGLDYEHGTGHGVGFCLSVHEGPQSISKRGQEALLPGMVVSIEPGYYKEGAYGIRLENLAVVELNPEKSGSKPFYHFSCLTQVPFDNDLIDWDLLTPDQRIWLEAYQEQTK